MSIPISLSARRGSVKCVVQWGGDGGWAVELSLVCSDHCWAKQVFQKIIIAFMVFLSFLQHFLCLYD